MATYPIYRSEKDMDAMPEGLYLGLFHGFKTPEERADAGDWGADGPMIGPLEYVHTTYATHVHIKFVNAVDSIKYGFQHDDPTLDIDSEDCVVFEDMQYGDWTVFYHKK